MFVVLVNNEMVDCYSSLSEIANSLSGLDPCAASYVEVFERIGNGNDVLKKQEGETNVSST